MVTSAAPSGLISRAMSISPGTPLLAICRRPTLSNLLLAAVARSDIGDGFVAALDFTGTNLIYCTYLGGSGDDQINGIAVRPDDGAVAVTGFTDSPNFPLMNAVQPNGEQGLFMSANGATSWNLSNAGLASGMIYSIQVDPSNPMTFMPSRRMAVSKARTAARIGLPRAAVWVRPLLPAYGRVVRMVCCALDPASSGHTLRRRYDGVYKTTNGAANWTSAGTGLPAHPAIQTVAVDPTASTTLYAERDPKASIKAPTAERVGMW